MFRPSGCRIGTLKKRKCIELLLWWWLWLWWQ